MADKLYCVHCGADCGTEIHIWDEKAFCCMGCQQVYRLLNEHKLQQYYSLSNQPGIKTESLPHTGKFAYLDKEEVARRLLEFYEPPLAKISLYIPAIHCISCIWLLEHLNRLHPGIQHSSVHFVKKVCTITFNPTEISVRELVELLSSIHYQPEISLQNMDGKKKRKNLNSLSYKIGVAGFISGNVMIFSLPLYFNGKPLEGLLGSFFSIISFAMTLPLVFYCGSDYLLSAWKGLKNRVVNIDLPISIGILALFAVTTYEVVTITGQGYSDSLSGLLFFLLLGKWYQNKTYEALSFDRDYKSYFPVAVTRIWEDQEEVVLLKDIQIGDILLIRNKELIPADASLIEGEAILDYSFVSGESNPIKKEIGDNLYAGGMQLQGAIKVKVLRAVDQSQLTQLWNQSDVKNNATSHFLPVIDRISLFFTLTILFLAISGLIFWWLRGDFHTAIMVFSSVLIVTCPCALALSLPFTLGNSMRLLGLRSVYLKNTLAIENLSRVTTIVFDKTGTITHPDQSQITFSGLPLTLEEMRAVGCLTRQSTHPLSRALSEFLQQKDISQPKGFVEIPGKGMFAIVEGKRIRLGSHVYMGISEGEEINSSHIHLEIDGAYKGYFSVRNLYRQGVLEEISSLQQDYQLFLLSGDTEAEKEFLSPYFPPGHLYFQQSPQDKMDFIARLKVQQEVVLMAGDGLNDAGAFMNSDVALSVADDVYHFTPAGDIIMQAKQFKHLRKVIQFSRDSLTVVKFSFFISFVYNVFGLVYALSGNMSPVIAAILMPLSSVTVVAMAIMGTNLLARRRFGKTKVV